MDMRKKRPVRPIFIFLPLAAFTLAALLVAVRELHLLAVSATVLLVSRWVFIGFMLLYSIKRRTLTAWIIVSMLVGAEIGLDLPRWAVHARVFSLSFLRLIKTIIAPLLFSTLVVGIAGHADLKQVGRMGVKALVYFEIITTLALFIGLAAINISKAGQGIKLPTQRNAAAAVYEKMSVSGAGPQAAPSPPAGELSEIKARKKTAGELIIEIFPENMAKAVAEGHVLQIVVFSVLFGLALALLPEPKRRPFLNVIESLAETMFKFTNIVMYCAPLGVGAAICYTVGRTGLGSLVNLLKLLLTFYAAIIVFLLTVILPIALLIRAPLKKFLKAMAEPVAIAFASTSSEAALPRAMEAMEAVGVPRRIVAFVMPTGYSFNLDGSCLYLSLAAVFVAQAAGVSMSLGQQFLLVFTLMLTSKGVAGVPRAALVILLGTVASFGLPEWPVFMILGIDELLDMGRTSLNVFGNSFATLVIARWEKAMGREHPSQVVQEALEEKL